MKNVLPMWDNIEKFFMCVMERTLIEFFYRFIRFFSNFLSLLLSLCSVTIRPCCNNEFSVRQISGLYSKQMRDEEKVKWFSRFIVRIALIVSIDFFFAIVNCVICGTIYSNLVFESGTDFYCKCKLFCWLILFKRKQKQIKLKIDTKRKI